MPIWDEEEDYARRVEEAARKAREKAAEEALKKAVDEPTV